MKSLIAAAFAATAFVALIGITASAHAQDAAAHEDYAATVEQFTFETGAMLAERDFAAEAMAVRTSDLERFAPQPDYQTRLADHEALRTEEVMVADAR